MNVLCWKKYLFFCYLNSLSQSRKVIFSLYHRMGSRKVGRLRDESGKAYEIQIQTMYSICKDTNSLSEFPL